ncbi:MAG: fibrinogen-like YCDxxxxGGGW domain-containing protein [Ferruginibacter sp.]
MKKLLLILLGIIILNSTIAQNTLDNIGLTASTAASTAFSLRLLSSHYTGSAVQVRRSSDNAVRDIGFTPTGDLDTAALKIFAGTDNGYVTTWYDQSGYGRNLVKTDASYQPQIVFNGDLKYIGSQAAIDFSGNKGLVYDGSVSTHSVFAVIRSPNVIFASYHAILDGIPRMGGLLQYGGTSFYGDVYPLAIWKNGISKPVSETLSPVDEQMALCFTSRNNTLSRVFIGNYDGGSDGGSVLESEALSFSSLVPDGQRLAIQCSQGAYYTIATNCNTSIVTQPSLAIHAECTGSPARPITVDASGLDLTYQWYSNTDSSNSGGVLISGATSNAFVPPTVAPGKVFYYVEVNGSVGGLVTSNVSGGITTNASPIVSVSPSAITLHAGDSVTLQASGATTYSWGAANKTPLDYVSNYRLAVGLRQLRTDYAGPSLRLRRSTDNAESDFGFAGTDLDIAAISTFLGASAGYCTILYDQSGLGNNIVQTNPSQQPLFLAEGLNGKPVLRFSQNGPQYMSNPTNFPAPFTVIYTAKQTGPGRGRVLAGLYNNWLLGWWGGSKDQAHFDGWVSQAGGNPSDTNAAVYSATGTGSSSNVYHNGTSFTVNASGGVNGPYGISLNGSESSDADIAELFIFNSSLADIYRELVEKSSGSYYGISGPPPVSGPSLTVSPSITTRYTVTGFSANEACAVSTDCIVTILDNPGLANFGNQEKTYFDRSYTIKEPAKTSTGEFTYTSSDTSVATINGAIVTIVGAGISTIKAIQAADATHYSDSISALLTVSTVSVVNKNGQLSGTNYNYVNKNGKMGSQGGLNENGASNKTLSSSNGLSLSNPAISAYQIKTDYPASTDGLYWISNPNINGGAAFQIYADMTTDGGGWTLILCNTSPNPGWDNNTALLRNQYNPGITATYSIIAWADHLKKSSSGFQYMIDAQTRNSNGGIWTANDNYSFVSTSNGNTNITLNTKFGSWNYSDNDIEARMPWFSPGSQGLITTSNDANGSWWGTLIAAGGWDPAPWLGNYTPNPGKIWYWVR